MKWGTGQDGPNVTAPTEKNVYHMIVRKRVRRDAKDLLRSKAQMEETMIVKGNTTIKIAPQNVRQ